MAGTTMKTKGHLADGGAMAFPAAGLTVRSLIAIAITIEEERKLP